MKRRILSMLLAVALVLGCIPVTGLAVDAEPVYEVVTTQLVPDVELPENDELFALYAEQVLYGYSAAPFGRAAGDRLTGDEKLAYDALKPVIADVAAGNRSAASVSLGYGAYNVDVGGSIEYWVPDITVNFTEPTSDFDLNSLIIALISDCPYEMYWYEKTKGCQISYLTTEDLCFIRFYFTVAPAYGTATYAADTAKTSAASKAAANAKSVVSSNASKNDRSKLEAYKDYICNAVSYNSAAAVPDAMPYGDPWQMIYVFDGNTSTNVVCEGYSKAFQYLCDLSTFTNGTECYTVSGLMNGGNHMWNIVSLDGSNYLVDVTNSDTGTVGQNGSLFLATGTGSAAGGYTVGGMNYVYYDDLKSFWGTGSGSILTLGANGGSQDSVASGTCGDNLTWKLDSKGKLTISGSGPMDDFWFGEYIQGPFVAISDQIKTVVLSEGVTTVGSAAFYNCTNLTSVEFPAGITDIGERAFAYCEALTKVSLPDGVKSIGEEAFYNCYSVTEFDIPDTVAQIGDSAFMGCYGTTSLHIPSSLTKIGGYVYACCNQVTSFEIPNGVTEIGEHAFWGCESMASVAIPNSVKYIGANAFRACISLTNVEIPNSVLTIDDEAFAICEGLTSIDLGSGVTRIGNHAFYYCPNLVSLTIPKSVTSIGDNIYESCWALQSVEFCGNVPQASENAFSVYLSAIFYYPANNETWTEEVIERFSGSLTWVPKGLTITTQPTSAYLKVGNTATFKVEATGSNLTYQWQYKDPAVGTWYNSGMTGNKTDAIQVGAIVGRNNFQYRCKVTDGSGNVVYSNAATLTVFGIKTQPTSVTAKVNDTVTFKVAAVGNGLTYQWQYKDPSVGTWYNSGMTGNKTSVMTVEAIAFRNGFQYRCKITDSKSNVVYSNAATLTVKSGPSITTHPTSTYLKTGSTANFKVVATGTGLTYQWQYKDPAVGTWYSSTLTGNKTATIQVGATVGRNNFQYRCKVTDGNGNVAYSNAATLTVFGIKTQPTSATANLNANVTFKVVAVGNGLTYQWQYKDPSVGTWYNSGMTGNKTSVMTVEAIAFRNNFQYRCKITDSKGNVIYSNAATLTVKSGPSITTQPTSSYLKIGNTANFKVVATGTGLTYQWQYKDPAVGTWYSSTLTGNKTATIQVGATVGRNNFQYRCKVTDGNGNVAYSNAATLTVFGIKTQPTSATANLNANVTFKVVAVGNGLTYQWQYKDPSVGTWYNSTMTGNKTSVMTVEAIAFRNNFQYRCKITDADGSVVYSNAVTLTVKSGPSITTQPTSSYLKIGNTANFKVVATGTNLTYQWQYKDPAVGTWYSSTLTGNKTATIQVGATAGRNNFQYRCKITDGNGNVAYSNAATLTVYGVKTQPSSATANLNANVTFKVVAVGNGLTYQWQYKDPSVGTWYNSGMTGNKTSVMTVEAIAFRNNFQYRCKITDSKGNVFYSNAATLTVK